MISTADNSLPYDQYSTSVFSLQNQYSALIPDGTDLNTIKIPGNYHVGSNANAATLINSPVSSGFTLKVMDTISKSRHCQILITNEALPEIWMRSDPGGNWAGWIKLCGYGETIACANISVTTANYLTYFPSGSFNDAPLNSIVYIAKNVPLTDGPEGDSLVGYSSHVSSGYLQGTLLTFRAYETNDKDYSGLTQMSIGYRSTDFSPTFSYRIAITSSSGLTWSSWSKFEENGYLHSGNRVISAGRMSESVYDLDDLPPNVIWQIDKNCTGKTPESTLGHHPAPGKSCVVVDMAFSYSSPHGRVQTVYAIDGRVFWRYGYQNDVNDYRWSAWRQYATDIPAAPSADGIYTLQCAVSNGKTTYSWIKNG